MKVQHSKVGDGVEVNLTGDELAMAVDLFLYSRQILVVGPRTVKVNGQKCESAQVYVDPSGYVMDNGTRYRGNGVTEF